MLYKTKNYLPILLISIVATFILTNYLEFDVGVRASGLNFIKGLICSVFAFIFVCSTHLVLILIYKDKYLNKFKLFFSSNETKEIFNKALFNCAFEELLFRIFIFATLLQYSSFYFASAITCFFVYLAYVTKTDKLTPLLLVSFSVFANKLYYTHESYFLLATTNFFFWLSWLLFIKTESHNKINDKVLDIRNKINNSINKKQIKDG